MIIVSAVIEVPESIVSKAAELGMDIEKEFLEYIIKRLGLDPKMEMRIHLDLAEKFLEDGKKVRYCKKCGEVVDKV